MTSQHNIYPLFFTLEHVNNGYILTARQVTGGVSDAGYCKEVVSEDKIKRSQLAKQTAMIRRTIKEKSRVSRDVSFEVIPFSGLNKAGREDLYNIIEGFLTEENDMV